MMTRGMESVLRIAVLSSALVFLLTGCNRMGNGKMPLTTRSPVAREYHEKGNMMADNMRMAEARAYYQKAIEADSEFALAYACLAHTQTSQRDVQEAIAVAEELSRPQEVRAPSRSSSGGGLSIGVPAAVASDYLDQAMRRIDKVSRGERLLILTSRATFVGETEEVGKCLTELVKLYPRDARAHWLLGNHYYLNMQNDSAAIAEYDRTLALEPEYAPAYNMLGYVHWEDSNLKAAERCYRKYIDLAPDGPNSYDSYAEFLLRQGRHSESIAYYEKALQKDPLFSPSWLGLAANLNLLGKHAEARKHLTAVTADTSKPADVRQHLLWGIILSHIDEGDLQGALKAAEARLALTEKLGSSYDVFGAMDIMCLLLTEMGRFDESRAVGEKALAMARESDLTPDLIRRVENLSLLRLGCHTGVMENDLRHAKTSLDEWVSRTDTSDNWKYARTARWWAGRIKLAEANPAEAVPLLEQANLQNSTVLYYLGQAYECVGDSAKAAKCYDKACHANLTQDLDFTLSRKRAQDALNRLGSEGEAVARGAGLGRG